MLIFVNIDIKIVSKLAYFSEIVKYYRIKTNLKRVPSMSFVPFNPRDLGNPNLQLPASLITARIIKIIIHRITEEKITFPKSYNRIVRLCCCL